MRSLVAPLLVAGVLCASACGSGAAAPEPVGRTLVFPGSAAKLQAAIRSMSPKPVVVNYWATWCDPCKKEMPRLVSAVARYRRWVGFIGVNVEDDRSAAQAFARRYRVPFRSYAMSRAEVQRAQDILGLPVTQFFRADGELAFVHQGEISSDDLDEKIKDLIRVGRPAAEP